MPAITIYTDPLKAGIAQMPVFTVGDDQNFTLQFNDGTNFYNPTGVTVKIGYIAGLPDGTYTSAFQWVDRMANQHIGSFSITSGVPAAPTWDENPIGVSGADGAYLLLGRTPPSSQIRKVNVVYGGTGLSTAPKLRFNGGTGAILGQLATATVAISGTGISTITSTDVGKNYSSSLYPSVIVSGDGTGGMFRVATVANGQITAYALTAAGTGYTTATLQIVDPEATATATVGGTSAVITIALVVGGSGYTSAPTVAITGGGGASATATAALLNSTWGVSGLTITGTGSGYTTPPTISFTGGTGSGVTATAVVAPSGALTRITVTNPGYYQLPANSGYSVSVTITPVSGGTFGAGNAVVSVSSSGVLTIESVVLVQAGSGYNADPTVSFTVTGSSGTITPVIAATATAHASTGEVTSIIITNPGSGYGVTAPTVVFGSGAASATAQLIGSPVGSVALTAGGSGYTSQPLVGFSGGAGTGAAGVTTLSLGITAVAMVQGGYAYTSQPSVVIEANTNGAILEAAGIETYSVPYLRNFQPLSIGSGVQAVPWTHNRRDTAGNLVYDDSLLLIQPQSLISPTFTLQADGLTWAAVFTPVVRYVTALLNFRRSVTVDFTVMGGGRTLLSAPLTIQKAQ